jgi:RHS repeat-associated protein
VKKSTGKLYWNDLSGNTVVETDLAGNNPDEYIFFGGRRIARRQSSGTVHYYFADHLGSSRVVTNPTGTILDDSDFYPFGGERVVASSSGNNYKFTGKERDTESGLDFFGARYYASALGRFASVDPIWIKLDRLIDPQRLNLYAYARNNPLLFLDPTGMDVVIGTCSIGTTQDCFKELQAGLTEEDRNHVTLVEGDGTNGCDKGVACVFVDASHESDSENFQVLQNLANDHSGTAVIDVVKPDDKFEVLTMVSWNAKTGEVMGRRVMSMGDPKKGEGTGGYTFFPYEKGRQGGPFSVDKNTHAVANTAAEGSIAATIHHELRHVFLGDFGRSIPKATHGQKSVDDATKRAEDEAAKNRKKP